MKKAVLFSVLAFTMGFVFAQYNDAETRNDHLAVAIQVEQDGEFQQKTGLSEDPMTFLEFKQKAKIEKGAFLEVGSLAYQKYKKYNTMKICGWTLLATGAALAVPVGIPVMLCVYDNRIYNDFTGSHLMWYNNYVPGIICMSVGGGLMVTGAILLGCMGSQLQQSYYYYVQGQKKSVSFNWHPSIGTDYAGVGLTVRF